MCKFSSLRTHLNSGVGQSSGVLSSLAEVLDPALARKSLLNCRGLFGSTNQRTTGSPFFGWKRKKKGYKTIKHMWNIFITHHNKPMFTDLFICLFTKLTSLDLYWQNKPQRHTPHKKITITLLQNGPFLYTMYCHSHTISPTM